MPGENTQNETYLATRNYTCEYEIDGMIVVKFWLVAVFGTSIAMVSIVENILLFYLFCTRKTFLQTNLFFMTFIAFFDILISIFYFALLAVQVIMEYFRNVTLHYLWHWYLPIAYAISHSVIAAKTFIIVSATLERLLITLEVQWFTFNHRRRSLAVILSVISGFIIKGTVYFEVVIIENPLCAGRMSGYAAARAPVTQTFWYGAVFMFWFKHIICILIPFLFLSIANYRIVRCLKQKRGIQTVMIAVAIGRYSAYKKQESIRGATRMLVMVITSYLIANILNVILTFWEYIDMESLISKFPKLYTIMADTTSLLLIISSSLMLPIFYFCNEKVRAEIRNVAGKYKHSFDAAGTYIRKRSRRLTLQEFALISVLPSGAEE